MGSTLDFANFHKNIAPIGTDELIHQAHPSNPRTPYPRKVFGFFLFSRARIELGTLRCESLSFTH